MKHDYRVLRKFGTDYRWVSDTGRWSWFTGKRFLVMVSGTVAMCVYDPEGHAVYTTRHENVGSNAYRHQRYFGYRLFKVTHKLREDGSRYDYGLNYIYPTKIKISREQLLHMMNTELPEGFLRPDSFRINL